jgi:predicted ATPase
VHLSSVEYAVHQTVLIVMCTGFVGRVSDFGYHFLHDRVQQAAYECVSPMRSRQKIHLGVAQFLITKIKIEEDVGVRISLSLFSHIHTAMRD